MPTCRDCADHSGICPGSGKPCDPNDVIVEIRNARPPYKTWRELGHMPFEFYGERFAVTRNVGALDSPYKFRVSHIATGIAIPQSDGETKIEAKAGALAALAKVSEKKFKAALARARETIACAGT